MRTQAKPSIYLYPITPHNFSEGANDYIIRKGNCLSDDFVIVNTATKAGVLDIVFKFFKTDVIYFNWIEDLADKSFGYFQVAILFFVLISCRLLNKKIVWFIHNNISHYPKNKRLKKMIRAMMSAFADKTLTHSKHLDIYKKLPDIRCFDHPVEENKFVNEQPVPEYDLLIWGNQSPYKGVCELLRFNRDNKEMQHAKILIAGKFSSEAYYNEAIELLEPNVTIINRVIEENELKDLFSRSLFVLFCYKKNSVLSSAALAKTLSYGKSVIGPDAGAFKELGEQGLVYTYNSFENLSVLLEQARVGEMRIDKAKIRDYIQSHEWKNFKEFLVTGIKDITARKTIVYKRSMA